MAGIRLYNAIISNNWRAREAAVVAYLQFITDKKGLPAKYKDKTHQLFLATVDIAKMALEDSLLNISNRGLDILEQSLD